MGLIYYSEQDWDNAIAMMKRSYEIMRNRFGDENLNTLQPKMILASIYRDMKRFSEATPMLRDVIAGGTKLDKCRHPRGARIYWARS